MFLVLAVYILLYLILGFSKNSLYLLILSTVFGSLVFFGIPFVVFVFPTVEGEHLARLSSASISMLSVSLHYSLRIVQAKKSSIREGLRLVVKRLSRNPLIVSIDRAPDILSYVLT